MRKELEIIQPLESQKSLGKFEMLGIASQVDESLARPSISFGQDVKTRLMKNKVAMLGLTVILLMIIMAIIGPWITPHQYNDTNLEMTNAPISSEHWFGTDSLGRDLWARVWEGARISLTVGLLGAVIPSIIGSIIGGISGYLGGRIDMLIMRIIDIGMCVPALIYIILIMVYFGAGIMPIIFGFIIASWMGSARMVRGMVLQLKESEFVLASKALGASPARIIMKHLIPNTLGIIIVGITFSVPSAIFYEATLSFIGMGIQSPMTSWGQLANAGASIMKSHPAQLFIPAFFISLTMLSFNFFGDGLRDALDPKLRK